MKIALSWLKAYVPQLSCTDREFSDTMTISGTKVEGYTRTDKNLEKIVVGQILSIERHPDADKLIVCQVDIGGRTLQIVTGARNVREGDKVPVVLNGGKVAGGHDGGPLPENGVPIKAGKLRGVVSDGMLCSIEELGSSREMYPEAPEGGIYILDPEAQVGADAPEILGLRDTVFEFEVTSNRVDCYSVLGLAREAAAAFRLPFVPPVVTETGNGEDVREAIQVEVEDTQLCGRYCARVCKNIRIGPSPKWLRRRLASSGIRPINNLVDITNYVMEEYGQPMHAYDLDLVAGHKIIVRRAKEGGEFQTLDGQIRKLDGDMLMICDAEKEIGIAGIMGGENSKITDKVSAVLLESAVFYGAGIRRSAKRLGLRSEASAKFEKGLDARNALEAVNRACQLMEELGCGEVVGGVVDVKEPLAPLRRIAFSPEKINRLLGTELPGEEMLAILEREGLSYEAAAGELVVPSFRQDLEGGADLAEEVARFYGYDRLPVTLPRGATAVGKLPFALRVEEKAKDVAQYCGFSQAMHYSFESPKAFDQLLLGKAHPLRGAVTISNPLGEDFSVMRTTPLNGLLNSLATNFRHRNQKAKLFELGKVYLPKALPLTDLPDERLQFSLGFYGEGDFFTMKGFVEAFLDSVGMGKKPGGSSATEYLGDGGLPFLHPGRQAKILYDGAEIGFLGEVHPEVLDNYEIGVKAYVAVLDLPAILPYATFDRKYQGLARFPAVERDVSIVAPKAIQAAEIEKIIARRGGKLLETYELFDVYEGSQIAEGYRSMAYSVTFRAKDRTLEESDVAAVMTKILKGLRQLGVELRQ
ncbi:MAG: phenylalanine--tRNA ligase subunit beta [Clostridium sp.]|jgi:phenylalanyl-tRNA synthetase beta chain|nr:phenylalanine--tRNA ligase subunit beta [Clostridium sp.]